MWGIYQVFPIVRLMCLVTTILIYLESFVTPLNQLEAPSEVKEIFEQADLKGAFLLVGLSSFRRRSLEQCEVDQSVNAAWTVWYERSLQKMTVIKAHYPSVSHVCWNLVQCTFNGVKAELTECIYLVLLFKMRWRCAYDYMTSLRRQVTRASHFAETDLSPQFRIGNEYEERKGKEIAV